MYHNKSRFSSRFIPFFKTSQIKVNFDGGNVSSDGGVLLLRQIDRKVNILPRISSIMEKYDTRQLGKITHSLHSMLVQRIYGIACGYEDLNDHHTLRQDIHVSWKMRVRRYTNHELHIYYDVFNILIFQGRA